MNNNNKSTKQHKDISELSRRLQRLSIEQKAISDEIERIVNAEEYNDNKTIHKQIIKKQVPTDRAGTTLAVGQNVKLLTIGKFISTRGKITKIGKAKVTVQLDKTGKSTTRNFNNVLIQ
jgi:transcription antitermination factor NusG